MPPEVSAPPLMNYDSRSSAVPMRGIADPSSISRRIVRIGVLLALGIFFAAAALALSL
jgi:hypothetical protein